MFLSEKTPRTRRSAGFTLIEILTVLIIMSVMVAVAAPGLLGVIRSMKLTAAGDSLVNYANLAQQEAIATNIPTELRFYRFVDPNSSNSGRLVRAYQVVRLGSLTQAGPQQGNDGGYVGLEAVTEPVTIDASLAISEDATLSPLLQDFFAEGQTLFQRESAEYAALRFYPDGSFRVPRRAGGQALASEVGAVSTPLNRSYLTLTDASFAAASSGSPTNYYCFQLDPFTGKARVYRP